MTAFNRHLGAALALVLLVGGLAPLPARAAEWDFRKAPAAAITLPTLDEAARSALRGRDRLALVIGNGAGYVAESKLEKAEQDAASMAALLRALGYTVYGALNASREQIDRLLVEFEAVAATKDHPEILFYYSGHGVQVDGVNYLVPTDMAPTDEIGARNRGYSLNTAIARMGTRGPRIIILDACRSNEMVKGKSIVTPGLAKADGGSGSLVAFAAQPGTKAYEGKPDHKHSTFTEFFLRAASATPRLPIDKVFQEARRMTVLDSGKRQEPEYVYNLDDSNYALLPRVCAPAKERTQWEQANLANTAKAFHDFLATCPDAERAVDAQLTAARLEQIAALSRPVEASPSAAPPQNATQAPPPPVAAASTTEARSGDVDPRDEFRATGRRWTVDGKGGGDFRTIGAAIAKASAGDAIAIAPGTYNETLVLEKDLYLEGTGRDRGKAVIRPSLGSCVVFSAERGAVRNMTFIADGSSKSYCVDITSGRLLLADNDLSGSALAVVAVHGSGTDPLIIGNRIHDGEGVGIHITGNGKGRFKDNDIFGNARDGVRILEGGDPVFTRNYIHHGNDVGVFVHGNGKGRFENNLITGNADVGVWVQEGGAPVFTGNRINDGKSAGVLLYRNGQGRFEYNDIFGNASFGIEVRVGSDPIVTGNRIKNNKKHGIRVWPEGRGTYTDNDLRGNNGGPWQIDAPAQPVVHNNRT